MYAIASLLDTDGDGQAQQLWQVLKTDCCEAGVNLSSNPHISWVGAQKYDLDGLSKKLRQFIQSFETLEVTTTGLGIFTGLAPVLYLAVVKTEALLKMQRRIHNLCGGFADDEILYYRPENWVPHISVAYRDVQLDTLVCAIRSLALKNLTFTIKLQSMDILYDLDGKVGIYNRFKNTINQ
jgi:2'-5' RNA ligase